MLIRARDTVKDELPRDPLPLDGGRGTEDVEVVQLAPIVKSTEAATNYFTIDGEELAGKWLTMNSMQSRSDFEAEDLRRLSSIEQLPQRFARRLRFVPVPSLSYK